VAPSWIKLWARWYETTSHALLSPQALHTGPHLLTLAAKAGPDATGTAWLKAPDGGSYSLDDLAKLTRWPKRTLDKVLGELRQAGTVIYAPNVWGFPNFQRWQESPSAARVRRHRLRKRDGNSECNASVTTEAEDRGQKQKTETPPTPSRGEPWTLGEWAQYAWKWYERQRCEVMPGARMRGLSDKRKRLLLALHKHVAQTVGKDEAKKSIDHYLEWRLVVAGCDPKEAHWLPKDAIWRPGSWDYWRNLQEAEESKRVSEDYERRQAEEKAKHEAAETAEFLKGAFG
jgi:hypothetical protein